MTGVPGLLFEVDGQRYSLEITQISKVLPSVRLRSLPHAPEYVAGVLEYRKAMVPVIDMSRLIAGTSAAPFFSTRIILVHYPTQAAGTRLLGLLAEHVTDGLDDGPSELQSSGVAVPEAPYLGSLGTRADGIIQYVRIDQLLPAELRERLFLEESLCR